MEIDPDVCRWLDYAQEDLDYGLLGLGRYPRGAAWSFQQAAEKALKACLLHTNRVPPRTHDLVLLFNLLEIRTSNELKLAVLLLAEITTSGRYPDDAEPVSEALAMDYSHAARIVIAHARGVTEGGR